jgi:hypothetical protein
VHRMFQLRGAACRQQKQRDGDYGRSSREISASARFAMYCNFGMKLGRLGSNAVLACLTAKREGNAEVLTILAYSPKMKGTQMISRSKTVAEAICIQIIPPNSLRPRAPRLRPFINDSFDRVRHEPKPRPSG